MRTAYSKRDGVSPVKKLKSFTGIQVDLFQHLEEPAQLDSDLDLGPELLGAINTAVREAKKRRGLSVDRIVDEMNLRLPGLRKPLTVRQFRSWTAQSQEYKEFPARYLTAFCAVTDCDLPMRVLANGIGQDLIDAREAAAKELGQTYVETGRLRRRQQQLKRQLGEL